MSETNIQNTAHITRASTPQSSDTTRTQDIASNGGDKTKIIHINEGTNLNDFVDQIQFPVEVFPKMLQNVVSATNASLQFPTDFICSALLYAASVAIGNTTKVKVTEGWTETAILYLALVGRPGTNKTHPLAYAIDPIIKRDSETFREYKASKSEYETSVSLSRKEREELGIPEPQKPSWKKLLVSDITPEALAEIHSFNLRGIALYTDELASWFRNFNRYHKGAEQEFWLSNWSHKPIIIDRKGGEPVFISEPFISVAGTIQDGVLNELAKESRAQNGFIDRILFAAPQHLQKPYWSAVELDPAITSAWHGIANKLLSLPFYVNGVNQIMPEVLRFTPEAYRILFAWQSRNTDTCNEAEDETLASIYVKLEIYAIRLSLVLHLLHWACTDGDKQAIQETTVEGAIKLVEYFRGSAKRVQDLISAKPVDKLPDNKREFYAALPKELSTGEAIRIAEEFNLKERTLKEFLKDQRFFKHIRHGQYEKRYS